MSENEDLQFASALNQLPPHNLEVEEAVLGGILLDPGAIERVKDVLKPFHFYLKAHNRIYEAALKLHLKEQPTNLIFMRSYLKDNDLLDLVGGITKLTNLVDRTVSAANIEVLAQLVVEKWQRRQLGKLGTTAIEMMHKSEEVAPMDQVIEQLQQMLVDLQRNQSSEDTTHISESLINTFQDIETRHQGIALPGIPCGFYDLDGMTSGFQRGDLIIVAGRPSMGKTAFCLNLVHNIAASSKLPIAIFTLEMSKSALCSRLLASESGIETSYLRSGRISQTQWEPLSRSINFLSDMSIYLNESTDTSPAYIERECRKVELKEKQPLGMIVIDYLQLIPGGESGFNGNRNQQIGNLSRSLKKIAMKMQCPVICLSQLSRAVEARTNKRPMLSDLRDSGSIEQDADLVLMLYRDDYYNPDSPDRGEAEIIIAKHRNGPTGTVKLLFDNQLTKFKNLARPNYY